MGCCARVGNVNARPSANRCNEDAPSATRRFCERGHVATSVAGLTCVGFRLTAVARVGRSERQLLPRPDVEFGERPMSATTRKRTIVAVAVGTLPGALRENEPRKPHFRGERGISHASEMDRQRYGWLAIDPHNAAISRQCERVRASHCEESRTLPSW